MFPKKALVADDDGLVCWAIQKELAARHVDTCVANTGQECLAAVRENRFDLVFLDIHFPDENGIELLKVIRKFSPDTQIVIISGDGSLENKENALSCGAVQFLEKPFDIQIVRKVVTSFLREGPRTRKHNRYFCNFPVRLSIVASAPGESSSDPVHIGGTAEDVGLHGIRVTTDYPLGWGQGIRLTTETGGDPFARMVPRDATAEVIWTIPGEGTSTSGLKFFVESPRSI